MIPRVITKRISTLIVLLVSGWSIITYSPDPYIVIPRVITKRISSLIVLLVSGWSIITYSPDPYTYNIINVIT